MQFQEQTKFLLKVSWNENNSPPNTIFFLLETFFTLLEVCTKFSASFPKILSSGLRQREHCFSSINKHDIPRFINLESLGTIVFEWKNVKYCLSMQNFSLSGFWNWNNYYDGAPSLSRSCFTTQRNTEMKNKHYLIRGIKYIEWKVYWNGFKLFFSSYGELSPFEPERILTKYKAKFLSEAVFARQRLKVKWNLRTIDVSWLLRWWMNVTVERLIWKQQKAHKNSAGQSRDWKLLGNSFYLYSPETLRKHNANP